MLRSQPPARPATMLTVTALTLFIWGAANATQLDDIVARLNEITKFTDNFCKVIPQERKSDKISISGEVKAELARLIKILAEAGLEGAIRYESEEGMGVLQEDLLEAINTNTECRLAVWNDLNAKLILNAEAQDQKLWKTIVLIDSPFQRKVYDGDTFDRHETNADDISRILVNNIDTPLLLIIERAHPNWKRQQQVLRMNPDLIIVHYSAFADDQSSRDSAALQFRSKIRYLKTRTDAKFLFYSRIPGFNHYHTTVAGLIDEDPKNIRQGDQKAQRSDRFALLEIRSLEEFQNPDLARNAKELYEDEDASVYCRPKLNPDQQKLSCEEIRAFCSCNDLLHQTLSIKVSTLLSGT